MNAILISTVVLLFTMQSFLCKIFTDSYPGKRSLAAPVFTVVSGAIVAMISFAFAGFAFSPKPLTLLLALMNAVALFGYDFFIVKSSQSGPYSIVMVFSIAGGITIPSVAAVFAFNETLSVIQIISLLVIFASVWLITQKEEAQDEKQKVSPIFIFFCFGLAVSNGLYGMFLDVQQRLTGSSDRDELVALTFIGATVISAVQLLITERKGFATALKQTKKSFIFLMICSVISALAVNLMVYIIPLVNVTLLYTLDNSGTLLLSLLCSCIFFKEKLSVRNIIGCAIMCAGLVCISLF